MEINCIVTAEMFRVYSDDNVIAQAEIEEVRWVHQGSQNKLDLAPLTRDVVLPAIWA